MNKEIFSNHIGSAGELTVLAPIKPGFVPISDPLTYAARLRIHLRMLSALRRNGLETDRAGVYVGPVDTLRTLQYVRWTLCDNDTKMLLSVNFDQGFEPYIRRIVDIAGPLLDTILCHCEGFTGFASDQGYERFMSYATKHQVPVDLFAAAAPDISVDDGDYFLEFDKRLREGDYDGSAEDWQPGMTMTRPKDKLANSAQNARLALLDQGLNIVRTMYENADRFPEWDFRGEESRDDLLYYRLTEKLVPQFWDRLADAFKEATGHEIDKTKDDWKRTLLQLLLSNSGSADKAPPPDRVTFRTRELLLQHKEPLGWFASPPRKREISSREVLPEDTIQRGLLADNASFDKIKSPAKGFKATHACMMLLRIDDPVLGASFLEKVIPYLWPDEGSGHSVVADKTSFNLSITHNGLKTLGLPEEERLQFPLAFREGMDARAGLLGDTDCNHPNEWKWPKGNWPHFDGEQLIAPSSIDLIIQVDAALPDAEPAPVFGPDHPLLGVVTNIDALASANGVALLSVEAMQRKYGKSGHAVGHIGFADGVSQPKFVAPTPPETAVAWDEPFLGELLIGHQSRLDSPDTYLQRDGLMRNGTFQVIRKTRLDVKRFNEDAARFSTVAQGVDANLVKAKMVGRNADSTNLSDGTDGNVFGYADDPTGAKTPLQSHVRRTNPREFDTPRLVRRGFSYGPYTDADAPDDADRGLMFIAYNANIAEQFEVIQRWISGGNSTGIASWHGDPLLAPKRPEGSRAFRFTHDGKVVSVDLPKQPMGVLQWGVYAFTPSLNGIRILANLHVDQSTTAPQSDPGYAPPTETEATKLVLEDPDDENRHKRAAIWADIRRTGATDAGDYGILIGGTDEVQQLLHNKDGIYSVSPYLERMGRSIGEQYLGVDDPARHGLERKVLESFLQDLGPSEPFTTVLSTADAVIDALPFEEQSLEDDGYHHITEPSVKPLGIRLESEAFINKVAAILCVKWFGLPDEAHFDIGGPQAQRPHCPRDFVASSFYVFGPHPTEFVEKTAMDRTQTAVTEIEAFLTKNKGNLTGDFLTKLQNDPVLSVSERKMAEYIAGACFGFAGPVTGSFRSVLYDWIKTERLWRIQQRFLSAMTANDPNTAKDLLKAEILASMAQRPIPDLLHRKAVKSATVGGVNVQPGDKIVFSLRSAIEGGGDAEALLFGGDYTKPNPPMHSCPGKTMGLQTLIACFAAILSRGQLTAEGPLTLRLKTRAAAADSIA